jgi:hypothetical protein
MKLKFYIITGIILIIIILVGVYTIKNSTIPINSTIDKTNESFNNSIVNNTNITVTPIPFDYNSTLSIPSNDYIINHINWSSNPNLEVGYIDLAQVMEPNEYVPHTFVAVGIKTQVINTDNDTIIREQLSNVARDVRRICGPNTAIVIMGMNHDVLGWSVTMRVYDNNIY